MANGFMATSPFGNIQGGPIGTEGFNESVRAGAGTLAALALQQKQEQFKQALAEQNMLRNIKLFQNIMSGGGGFQPSAVVSQSGRAPNIVRGGRPANQPGFPDSGNASPFVSKPSFTFDPVAGKFQVGISQVQDPEFVSKKEKREEALGLGTTLRKEFTGSPQFKTFQEVNTRTKQLDSLLEASRSGDFKTVNSLDQALISIFNKVTDPGSVVRESEFARTPQNLPLINRMQASIGKLFRGDVITDQDREDLVKAAKIIANETGEAFNLEIDRFGTLTQELDVPEKFVTGGFSRFKPFNVKRENVITQPVQFNQQQIDEMEKKGAVGFDNVKGIFVDKFGREVK